MQYDLSPPTPSPSSDFLASLTPSYLTIDVDGRVLGIQTFTKVLAPGCRTGWIVAQPAFIDKLTLLTTNTTSNPSGFAEAALSQLLSRSWGMEGWVRWIEGLMVNYKMRRDLLAEVLEEERDVLLPGSNGHSGGSHTSKKRRVELHEDVSSKRHKVSLYNFRVPPGGFYLWVTINLVSHPIKKEHPELSNAEIIMKLWSHLVAEPFKIVTVPGTVFAATAGIEKNVSQLRLTFGALEIGETRDAGRAFAAGVKSFWMGEGWETSESELGEDITEKSAKKDIRKRKRMV